MDHKRRPGEAVMNEKNTKAQLIDKLTELRHRITELETSEAERKKAEEALHASEERYRNLFENATDAIFTMDLKTRFTSGNRKAREMCGYSRDELIGEYATLILPEEEIPRMADAFRKGLKGEINTYETKIITKKGKLVPVEVTSSPIEMEGKIIGTIGVARDITERKQGEKRVKESEEGLRTLFECIADGVIVTDLSGTVVRANDGAARLAGCSNKEELIGRNAFEFVSPKDRALAMDATKKTLEEGLVHERTEYTILTVDGREIDTDSSAAVLHDRSGNPIGIINVVRDITRRKQLERERKELERKAQLNSHLASVGEMAAGFAHEINNPLTGTTGFAQLLLKKDLPEDIKEYISDINEGAQRACSVVRRMLMFVHQTEPLKTRVDINEVVKSTIRLRSYELKTNNIHITTRLASDLPRTLADASQLQEVVINIMINAETEMKLAHGRGKLLITAKRIDDSIRISFQDDGPGIAEENLDKIFEPWFTTKKRGQGTGLGLSICRRIVAEHQGIMYAKSKPGQGATFIMELPIAAGEKQPELAELSDDPQKVAKAKILVIDDEPGILKLLSRMLTDAGHKVETIDNCSDALQKIKSERYHLILLDIRMPDMSGIELYQHIKKIDRLLARSVVFITADAIGRESAEFLHMTKAPYITKPFDIAEVEKTVTRELSRNIIQP